MEINTELLLLINKQINCELLASYQYLAYYNYFKKNDISLDNIGNFFYKESLNESKHAKLLIDYIHSRNGIIHLTPISIPTQNNELTKIDLLHDIINIFEDSYNLELDFFNNLSNIATKAGDLNDHHLNDFITSNFLEEQIDSMNELQNIISKFKKLLNDSSPNIGIITINNLIKCT